MKKYVKSCDFCGITISSAAFSKHVKSAIHINNQNKSYDNIKFTSSDSTQIFSFNNIIQQEVLVDNKEFNLQQYTEQKYILQTENKRIILDRYEKTPIENISIGIRYIIKDESEINEKFKTKDNIIARQIYTIDNSNNSCVMMLQNKL